ncbi:MAG: hypothetical protein IJ642_12045 [Oscillospiraceae bacterium]|nr:hypothetical protein [Oscillospiraceae bacterium]
MVATAIIAALALLLSIFNTITLMIDKSRNFSILFDKVYVSDYVSHHDQKQDSIKIKYTISNYSQLPISITRIRIIIDDNYFDVDYIPHYIESSDYKSNGKTISETILNSTVLPIQLSALGANSGFLAFAIPKGTLTGKESKLKFQISTNRGEAITADFTIGKEERFKKFIFWNF